MPMEEISEEEELMRQLKERQNKRRKEESERIKKHKDLQEEKQKRLSKEADELKKKPFTYNSEGEVVIINPPKYDKMPPTATSAKFTLPENEEIKAPKHDISHAKPRK